MTFKVTGLHLTDERYCDSCDLVHQTGYDSGPDWECFLTKTGLEYDLSVPYRGYYIASPSHPLLRPGDCPLVLEESAN